MVADVLVKKHQWPVSIGIEGHPGLAKATLKFSGGLAKTSLMGHGTSTSTVAIVQGLMSRKIFHRN